MASESLKEFRKMAPDQLTEREAQLRTELFKLRTQSATEKVKDVSQFKKVKRDIARLLTLKAQAAKAASKTK